MKLLLTSAGLTNNSITKALTHLVGKPLKKVKLAFIPTAANDESGDKGWLIEDLKNCQKAGFEVDIVDISALPQSMWLPRLEAAEVLLFGGGNTFHLMHWMNESGLRALLPKLLESRIYVGISAGSCIAGPTIYNSVQNLFDEKYELEVREGLHLVDFQFIPHLNSRYFRKITAKNVEKAAADLTEAVYVLDDTSALVIDGTNLEVVSGGEWHVFNE